MDYVSATVLLFFIMDPVGNIPVFHNLLEDVDPNRRARIILRELLFAYAILCIFLFAGEAILSFLGLKQPSLSIAGGIILFLIAIGMVFPGAGIKTTTSGDTDPFLVPLAVPLVAGPSAIAALFLLVSQEPGRLFVWWGALSTAWAVTAVVLGTSPYLFAIIRRRGARALERLIGMLLIMMAVQMFLDGVGAYFNGG
jgi:multiple antibiotic resistance protein